MSAFGQKFDSNTWLRTSRNIQQFYPRVDAGGRSAIGDTFWVPWWLTDWVYVVPSTLQQAQLIRSTWLTTTSLSPRIGPLVQRSNGSQGQVVWNNWWFNTPYQPVAKRAFSANRGVYSYAGQAANLGALHTLNLVGAGAVYAYIGPSSFADRAVDGITIPYDEEGQSIHFIGRHITVNVDRGLYQYAGGTATKFRYLRGHLKGYILTTSTRTVLGPKRVSEEIGTPFDFSGKMLAGDVLSLPDVTISVWSGADPNPQALYQGSSLVDGSIVYVTLVDGVAGTIYQVEVGVTASVAGLLSQMAYLTVLPDSL